MKATFVSLALAGLVTTMMVSEAGAWACNARGTTGATGWSSNYPSRSGAIRRALAECAVRTPRGEVCRITSCNRD